MRISLIASAGEKHYQIALLESLLDAGLHIEFVGNDRMAQAQLFQSRENVTLLNLRGSHNSNASLVRKLFRTLKYYCHLLTYAARTHSDLFHIQWLNRFALLDRTLLNLYYKCLGKKLIFTAHNVDAAVRTGRSGFLNRWSHRIMYSLMDHIIVHTPQMKTQLTQWFNIPSQKVTVISHGINNQVPRSGLTSFQARTRLNIDPDKKLLLLFGNLDPYKGADLLIDALGILTRHDDSCQVMIAGPVASQFNGMIEQLQKNVCDSQLDHFVHWRLEFIPDEEIETYFMAADCLVLPYYNIFQSGVMFLSYQFGLPIIATDVGSFRQDIIEAETGFIARPQDAPDLAEKIIRYFQSPLYHSLEQSRKNIIGYASRKYSWQNIARETQQVYRQVLSA